MIPIAKPLLGKEEKDAVMQVLNSGLLAQGEKVAELERNFAQFIGVKQAVATSNGTTALHAALLAHDISDGDEVITSPFTFIATANTICMCGAKPVFVDIDDTFNINPNLIEAAITHKTKAIMPVHLFGRPANMDQIMAVAHKHNLIVIEDACQAHGAEWQGQKVGSFGTGCFSFYPTKNMTTGEGGMVTTDNPVIAARLRKIIAHGSVKRYYHDSLGYNYRLTDIGAAIGIEQLKKLPEFNQKRKLNAFSLNSLLQANPIKGLILPEIHPGHVFHQYTVRITPEFSHSREKVIELLNAKGIGNSIFYPLPLHKQEAYPEFNSLSFPVAEKMAQEVLSLPVHPALTFENLSEIAASLIEIGKQNTKG